VNPLKSLQDLPIILGGKREQGGDGKEGAGYRELKRLRVYLGFSVWAGMP
jgi:hypothetical protein